MRTSATIAQELRCADEAVKAVRSQHKPQSPGHDGAQEEVYQIAGSRPPRSPSQARRPIPAGQGRTIRCQ